MKKRYLFLFLVTGVIVAIDQVVKMYVHTHFFLGESVAVIPNFFNITYVRNPGAAFGFLAESHPAFRELFFLAMPPFAMLVIILILRGVRESDFWQIGALSFVFAGAVGNYIDRVRLRYVIDFLDFHWKEKFTYPAFNVADMAIVGGMIVLIVLMIFEKPETESKSVPSV